MASAVADDAAAAAGDDERPAPGLLAEAEAELFVAMVLNYQEDSRRDCCRMGGLGGEK